MNTSRRALAGAGASGTASLAFGGNLHHGGPNAAADETENFNGTSWTEVADLNQARSFPGGTGTNTSGYACPMESNSVQCQVKKYNGITSSYDGAQHLASGAYLYISGFYTAA